MSAGRLVAVVGASGVGKDSLIAGLAAARPALVVVRRVITRAPGLGGEPYVPVSQAEFARLSAAGAFCLSWQAHGLDYGIPAEVQARVAAGEDAVVNLSRGVLAEAAARFARLVVLNVTAEPEVLARRLAQRGRESVDDIRRRLARAAPRLPEGLAVTEIRNDGAMADTVAQALDALDAVRA